MKLSKDEFIHMEETYLYAEEKASVEAKCEGFDWSSVDWTQVVTPEIDLFSYIRTGNDTDAYKHVYTLYEMINNIDLRRPERLESITLEEFMEESSYMSDYRREGITYDSFDEDVKTVLNEAWKLSSSKLSYIYAIYEYWQDTNS